jgi:hypothetical protein
MKKAMKKKWGVYTYLHSTKVLETGSDLDIAITRKAYWKAYKAKWRKEKRTAEVEFTLTLTKEESEVMAKGARQHRQSKSRFIRNAAFAYLGRRYLVPDPLAIATIRQLLAMNYDALQMLFDDEKKVINELYHPKEFKENGE